jgi:hypothetical protein
MILRYTAWDYNNALNILAKIYDVTTGSPVFVENLVMTPLGFGGTYFKQAPTPPPGSTYVANMAVYTDSSFMIFNTNYTPGDAEIPNPGNSGGGTGGSCSVVGYVNSAEPVGYVNCD